MDDYVKSHLKHAQLEDLIPAFEGQGIDEHLFLRLNSDDIKELIPKVGPRKTFTWYLNNLKTLEIENIAAELALTLTIAIDEDVTVDGEQVATADEVETCEQSSSSLTPMNTEFNRTENRGSMRVMDAVKIFDNPSSTVAKNLSKKLYATTKTTASVLSTPSVNTEPERSSTTEAFVLEYHPEPAEDTTVVAGPEAQPRTINILLLGETGVGKSTWVNGFMNYLRSASLEEAEEAFETPIPASFTILDGDSQEKVIRTGFDNNEADAPGESCTQTPRNYIFTYDDKLTKIRLIDTPGIGDSRGIDQDKENFQLVVDHLSTIDELHGICILLKPNNARLNIVFTFCLKELLARLHKDAAKNVVFCFTNARSTFYGGGDTVPALRKLLSQHENMAMEIPLNTSTMYYVDNEAYDSLQQRKMA